MILSTMLAMLAIPTACGPIEYINTSTLKASSEVAAAKSVNAAKWAPYYYTLAVEYLHQSRVEASYADYQAANRFGRRSAVAAKKARMLAIERAKNPEKYKRPIAPDGEDMAPLIDIDDDSDEDSSEDE